MKKSNQEAQTHVKNIKTKTESHCFSVGITWVDAPLAQFAKIDSDFKLRCKVQANPAANIDWLKESVIISSGEFIVLFCRHLSSPIACTVVHRFYPPFYLAV